MVYLDPVIIIARKTFKDGELTMVELLSERVYLCYQTRAFIGRDIFEH
jgi:hypothetical protein